VIQGPNSSARFQIMGGWGEDDEKKCDAANP
jgi:hypothetical protein